MNINKLNLFLISLFICVTACAMDSGQTREPLLGRRLTSAPDPGMALHDVTHDGGDEIVQRTNPSKIEVQKKHKLESVKDWMKTYGLSLFVSGTICALATHFLLDYDNGYPSMFSYHAFADTIAISLKDVNILVTNKKTFVLNVAVLVAKLVVVYSLGVAITNLEENCFPEVHLGWGTASLIAMFYILSEHFTNETHEITTALTSKLTHILHDPQYAKQQLQLAEKVLEKQLSHPEIIAKQIYDEKLMRDLARIQKDPELLKQFQQAYEAYQAMTMRMIASHVLHPAVQRPAQAQLRVSYDHFYDGEEQDAGAGTLVVPKQKAKEVTCTLDENLKRALIENKAFLLDLLGVEPTTAAQQKEMFAREMKEQALALYLLMKEQEKHEVAATAAGIAVNHEKDIQEQIAQEAQAHQQAQQNGSIQQAPISGLRLPLTMSGEQCRCLPCCPHELQTAREPRRPVPIGIAMDGNDV